MTLTRQETRWGHAYKLDGAKVDGVTTIINGACPKPALIDWAARLAAEYAVNHWDNLTDIPISQRLDNIRDASSRERDAGAARGTAVHELVAKHRIDGEAFPPPELAGPFRSYLRWVELWKPEDVLVEAVIGNRTHWWAGTLDGVARLTDGRLWLYDVKTNKPAKNGRVVWAEAVLQLAAYAHAEFYVDGNGDEQPMPRIDRAGVLWLGEDDYQFVPVQADDDAYEAFRLCQHHSWWLKKAADRAIGDPLEQP